MVRQRERERENWSNRGWSHCHGWNPLTMLVDHPSRISLLYPPVLVSMEPTCEVPCLCMGGYPTDSCWFDTQGMRNGRMPRNHPVVGSFKGIPFRFIPNRRKVIPYLSRQQGLTEGTKKRLHRGNSSWEMDFWVFFGFPALGFSDSFCGPKRVFWAPDGVFLGEVWISGGFRRLFAPLRVLGSEGARTNQFSALF